MDPDRIPEDLLRHAGFVHALARAALRGDPECDDVGQDAWVAALQRAPGSYEHRRSWFARVVRHRAFDVLRGRRRRAERERAAARPAARESTLDAVERAETGRRLVEAVLALEEPFRAAVLLRFLDGLSPREVAARTGVPVETVRSRTRRGLERLRARLDERDERGGRPWRLGLAALGAPVHGGGPVLAVLGGLVMKKVVVASALLLLVGGATWWFVNEAPRRSPAAPAAEGELTADPATPAADRATLEPRAGSAPGPATPTTAPGPAKPAQAAGGWVRGRVVGDDGTGIADARLASVAGFPDLGGAVGDGGPQTVTDSEGRFELPVGGTQQAGLSLRVLADGWYLPSLGSMNEGVRWVPAGKDSTITLARGVPLHVTVFDEETGDLVAGARVKAYVRPGYVLYNAHPLTEGVTGNDGTLVLRVPGGSLRVVADAPGYAQREGGNLEAGGEGTRTEIRLERGGAITGIVTDPEGRSVSGARVTLLRAPAVHSTSTTDAAGRFRFEHVSSRVPAGPDVKALRITLLAVDAEGFVRTWHETESPPPGGGIERSIVLMRPRSIAGRIKYRDGAAASDVPVQVRTQVGEGDWGWTTWVYAEPARTAVDGSFRVGGVTPGKVSIHAGAELAQPLTTLALDPRGELETLDLVIDRELPPVVVRVLDSAGAAVKGASVGVTSVARADAGGLQGGRRLSGADGIAAVSVSEPGPWWLVVDAPGASPLVRRVEPAETTRGPVDARPGEGVIEGRVERLDGSPARVRLALTVVLRLPGRHEHLDGWAGAVDADEQGRFRFPGVREGVAGIRCLTPGFATFPTLRTDLAAGARDVRVLVLDESEAARLAIEVVVLDADEKPLPGRVNVTAERAGDENDAWLMPNPGVPGLHRTQTLLTPGRYRVRAQAMGFEPEEAEALVDLRAPAPRVRLLLRRTP